MDLGTDPEEQQPDRGFPGYVQFPKAWETTAWIGSMMYPIMGILLIIS